MPTISITILSTIGMITLSIAAISIKSLCISTLSMVAFGILVNTVNFMTVAVAQLKILGYNQ